MTARYIAFILCAAALIAAEKKTVPELIGSLGEQNIQKGTAVSGHGEDFTWAIRSASEPTLLIDGAPGPVMNRVEQTDLWYATGKLAVGTSHGFEYRVAGKPFGGKKDVPAYGPESYLKSGVPSGTLSDKLIHTSKIYDGLRSDYWIYAPAQYDPKTPAALMVFQDGHNYNQRDNDSFRILDAVDNLIYEHKIPVMIVVFISPGDISQSPDGETYKAVKAYSERSHRTLKDSMRSTEYDTVTDRYARMLRDELLPEVQAKYNIRKDAYSRGISGLSSGGICSFNVAWQQPEQFSRVLSWIGSYAALQPEPNGGGQFFPAMVERDPKRNIRVWLQDGAEDIRNWPMQNVEMANALKAREYDFHFSFGNGTHSPAQGSAEFPQSFIWLWRDYDPAKTEQQYVIDPAEKEKPMFRLQVYNRDHSASY